MAQRWQERPRPILGEDGVDIVANEDVHVEHLQRIFLPLVTPRAFCFLLPLKIANTLQSFQNIVRVNVHPEHGAVSLVSSLKCQDHSLAASKAAPRLPIICCPQRNKSNRNPLQIEAGGHCRERSRRHVQIHNRDSSSHGLSRPNGEPTTR
eukprot:503203-Rhodomonas_salina.1